MTVGAVREVHDEGDVAESREDRFRRIAGKRINRMLGDLALIEKMSDSGNYRYRMEDVEAMLTAIDNAVGRVRQRYTLALTASNPEKARHSFTF